MYSIWYLSHIYSD